MSTNPAHHQTANPPWYPRVTAHVCTRWDERTDVAASVCEAWHRGIDLTDRLDSYDDGRGDLVRIRYYEPADVLLVVRDTVLKTVLLPEEARARGFGALVRELAADAGE